MNFLLFLLILILFFVIFVVMGVLGFVRSIFGGKMPRRKPTEQNDNTQKQAKEKFFKPDEGEYVDYEEMKDE